VSAAGVGDDDLGVGDAHGAFAFDEVAEDTGRITLFEATQFLGQQIVERVSNHRDQHVEVDLDEDGRGEGVEVKELDGLGDVVLNAPATRVVAQQEFDA